MLNNENEIISPHILLPWGEEGLPELKRRWNLEEDWLAQARNFKLLNIKMPWKQMVRTLVRNMTGSNLHMWRASSYLISTTPSVQGQKGPGTFIAISQRKSSNANKSPKVMLNFTDIQRKGKLKQDVKLTKL